MTIEELKNRIRNSYFPTIVHQYYYIKRANQKEQLSSTALSNTEDRERLLREFISDQLEDAAINPLAVESLSQGLLKALPSVSKILLVGLGLEIIALVDVEPASEEICVGNSYITSVMKIYGISQPLGTLFECHKLEFDPEQLKEGFLLEDKSGG